MTQDDKPQGLSAKDLADIADTFQHYEETNWESDSLYWMARNVPKLLAHIAAQDEVLTRMAQLQPIGESIDTPYCVLCGSFGQYMGEQDTVIHEADCVWVLARQALGQPAKEE